MKRKIFSKLLMGALLVASVSSFTSCKDYDDDINGLRNDVEKRALQSELTALQTTVAGVQSTASDALAKATAAATATDLNSVKTELATVKANADKAAEAAAQGIKDAASAKEAAEVAQKAAEKAAADATAALKDYVKTADMEAALKEYVTATAFKEAVDGFKAQFDEFVATNNGSLEEMKAEIKKFQDTYNQIWSAVTSVSLYAAVVPNSNYNGAVLQTQFNTENAGQIRDLKFMMTKLVKDKEAYKYTRFDDKNTKSKKDGKFGDSTDKDFFQGVATYSASEGVSFADITYAKFPTSLIVRVSPTNADLTTADIKLMDASGTALTAVEVASVAPYKKVISRAGSESGLWEIKLNLKDAVDANKENVLSDWDNGNSKYVHAGLGRRVLYAVAVSNTTADAAEGRYAVSEYGVNIAGDPILEYEGIFDRNDDATDLVGLGKVKGIGDAKAIKVAGGRTAQSTAAADKIVGGKYQDKVWKNTTKTDVQTQDASNRLTNDAIKINNGGTVTVDLSADGLSTIKYYYVVRDDANAGGSDASELNAWKGYTYGGALGTMLTPDTKCEFTIEIPETLDKGDYIGFRIFAVNWDGTLVDPDGVPFEVWVGVNKNGVTAAGSFTPVSTAGKVTKVVLPISGTFVNNTAAMKTTGDKSLEAGVSGKTFKITDIAYFEDAACKKAASAAGKAPNAKYVRLTVETAAAENWAQWVDGTTVDFVSTTETATTPATPENEITISLTKALPTKDNAPAYTWKANQKNADGDYVAYMYAAYDNTSAAWKAKSWDKVFGTTTTTNTVQGFKPMSNAINEFWDFTNNTRALNYVVSFGNTLYNSDTKDYTDALVVTDDGAFWAGDTDLKYSYIATLGCNEKTAGKSYIGLMDNTTKHASTISYNFGKVSSENKKNNAVVDYIVEIEQFNTIYACPLDIKSGVMTASKKNYDWYVDKDGKTVDQDWAYLVYGNGNVATGRSDNNKTKGAAATVRTTSLAIQDYITFTNTYDPTYFNGTLAELVKSGDAKQRYVRVATTAAGDDAKYKPTLTSDENGKEDYFFVDVTAAGAFTFTANPSTISAPTGPVASTLKFYLLDAFGHYNEVKIPFKVVKEAPAKLVD